MGRKKVLLEEATGLTEEERERLRSPSEESAEEPAKTEEEHRKVRKPRKKKIEEPDARALVEALLTAVDAELTAAGLTPMKPGQRALLYLGAVGTVKKYGVGLESYPELLLGGGVAWTLLDKIRERKQKPEKPAPERGSSEGDPGAVQKEFSFS